MVMVELRRLGEAVNLTALVVVVAASPKKTNKKVRLVGCGLRNGTHVNGVLIWPSVVRGRGALLRGTKVTTERRIRVMHNKAGPRARI